MSATLAPMGAAVYFAQRRATGGGGLLEKIEQIFDAAGIGRLIEPQSLVATKIQVGAAGNITNLRPALVKCIVKRIRASGGRPFVTSCVVSPPQTDAISQVMLAAEQGIDLATVGAPFVVADGLVGADSVCLEAPGRHLGKALIASGLAQANTIIGVSHFTGAPAFGYCGALYNLGFLAVASAYRHVIMVQAPLRSAQDPEGGLPVEVLPIHAPRNGLERSEMNWETPRSARGSSVVVLEDTRRVSTSHRNSQERMVEAYGALATAKTGRLAFINVLLDITPDPDHYAFSDAPFVPDIGILASMDPVALDQASIDLINSHEGIHGTRLSHPNVRDKLVDLNPDVDWSNGLTYAESLGLGTRHYELLII